jgi:hypothetical protein
VKPVAQQTLFVQMLPVAQQTDEPVGPQHSVVHTTLPLQQAPILLPPPLDPFPCRQHCWALGVHAEPPPTQVLQASPTPQATLEGQGQPDTPQSAKAVRGSNVATTVPARI